MYPVSSAFVIAFHPKLNLDRIYVVRSFNHILEILNDVGHFTYKMIKLFHLVTTKQLRDCADNVFKRKEKYFLIEMFSCELNFTFDICKKWFDENSTRRNIEFDLFTKQCYRRDCPLDWENKSCYNCGFDLTLGRAKGPHLEKMTYLGLVVKKEHGFIRNIVEPEDLADCPEISSLKNYFEN